MTVTQMTTQTPQQRRAACSPVLIGVLTGALAPVIAVVYGIRQRSWAIGVVWIIPVLMWAFAETDTEGGMRLQRKYAFQLAAGALTGAIAYVKKNEAQKAEI